MRENEELKRLIGELTLDLSLGKKVEYIAHAQIKSVCAEALGISRKNVYRTNQQTTKDLELVVQINDAHKTNPAYGQYKMALALGVNHKRTERVMRLFHILAPRRKTHYFCTISTYNHHYTNLIKDISERDFVPHLIWVCDVSFFKFQGQFWYLATIEDLATRQILSSQVGKFHDSTPYYFRYQTGNPGNGSYPNIFPHRSGNRVYGKSSHRLFGATRCESVRIRKSITLAERIQRIVLWSL